MGQILESAQELTPRIRLANVSRRVGHGGTAWASETTLIQPQDGAYDTRGAGGVTDISMQLQVAAFGSAAFLEPEDARITGGTRSLVRRLLGLNIPRVSAATKFPASLPVTFSGGPVAIASKPMKRIAAESKQARVA